MNRADPTLLPPLIDNPMNEDRWSNAKATADRAGWQRRGMANALESLERDLALRQNLYEAAAEKWYRRRVA